MVTQHAIYLREILTPQRPLAHPFAVVAGGQVQECEFPYVFVVTGMRQGSFDCG